MRVFGLDPSLTSSGYAGAHGSGVIVPPKGADRGPRRLAWIRDAVVHQSQGADVVVIEGYSYGQKRGSSHAHALGELGGVIRLALFERSRPYVEVPPATLKRLATGKGNAPKDQVLAAAIRRLGYGGHDGNEADALWLYQAGLIAYELPGAAKVPQTHLEALAKVEWPAVNGRR